MSKAFSRFSLLLLVLALVAYLPAQDITKGSLSGVVHDATGAVIPGAKVLLTPPYGDHSTNTSASGEYTFLTLTVGSGYAISVEASGFSAAKVGGIVIGVNKQTTQDV